MQTTTPIAAGRRVMVTHDQPHRASYGWCNARHGQVKAVFDGLAEVIMDCGHTVRMPADNNRAMCVGGCGLRPACADLLDHVRTAGPARPACVSGG